MTIDDLMNFLLNHLRVSSREANDAVSMVLKTILLKYEAELYKVFGAEDVTKANSLSETESQKFLAERYQKITGETTDKLLHDITNTIVSEMMKKPRDYFNFAESES